MHKHKHDDRGCSNKKVDFGNNILFDLGVCGAGGLEKVHGKVYLTCFHPNLRPFLHSNLLSSSCVV